MRVRLRRWHLVLGATLLVAVVLIGMRLRDGAPPTGSRESEWPSLPHRVTVEVLNAGNTVGAARIATARLRRGGLDVVSFRNAGPEERDSTLLGPLVLVRRSDTTGVGRIREVLGPVEVHDLPDPRPLVDLTVIVGSDTAAIPR